MLLTGKNAVVTGSSAGIGRAIALSLAEQGARVIVNARGSGPAGTRAIDEVVDEIRAKGGEAVGLAGAVDDLDFAESLVRNSIDSFGSIDILVNNAGILPEHAGGPIEDCPPEVWRQVLAVNLTSVYNTSRAAIPHMKKQRWGRIVNAASYSGTGKMGGSAYASSKAALFGLGRAMAADYGPYGITINSFNPEARTAMADSQDPAAWKAMIDLWVDRGMRTQAEANYLMSLKGPDGTAPWVTYLCTEEASNLNGHVFAVEARRVALLSAPDEERILFRDYDAAGTWSIDELVRMAPIAFPLENFYPRRPEEVLQRWDEGLAAAE